VWLRMELSTKKENNLCPGGGAAQWSSHLPVEQKTRVRIPPGCEVFKRKLSKDVVNIYIIRIVCVIYSEKFRH
jgi:hypothetical protein